MPFTRAAVCAGQLGIDHVDRILRYATDDRWEHFVRDEEVLVEQLCGVRLWDDARRILAYWAMRVDDEIGVPPRCVDASICRAASVPCTPTSSMANCAG